MGVRIEHVELRAVLVEAIQRERDRISRAEAAIEELSAELRAIELDPREVD